MKYPTEKKAHNFSYWLIEESNDKIIKLLTGLQLSLSLSWEVGTRNSPENVTRIDDQHMFQSLLQLPKQGSSNTKGAIDENQPQFVPSLVIFKNTIMNHDEWCMFEACNRKWKNQVILITMFRKDLGCFKFWAWSVGASSS